MVDPPERKKGIEETECRLSEVSLKDVPTCVLNSITGSFDDITQGKDVFSSLGKQDRIFYLVGILIAVILLSMILS